MNNKTLTKYYPRNTLLFNGLCTGVGVLLVGLLSLGTSAASLLSLVYLSGFGALNRKQLTFEISLFYTIFNCKQWFTQINKYIILSALPTKNQVESVVKMKVDAVLTLLEPFELGDGLIQPAIASDWHAQGIDHLHIQAVDFLGLSEEQFGKAIEFMHRFISQNKRVLVHCKAGRGRSAAVVIAYLMKYGSEGKLFSCIDEAYKYVCDLRNINLNCEQREKLQKYLDK